MDERSIGSVRLSRLPTTAPKACLAAVALIFACYIE
jgi:hypothetical protein